jgi:hypothetical protein
MEQEIFKSTKKSAVSDNYTSLTNILVRRYSKDEIFAIKKSKKCVTFETKELKYDNKNCKLITLNDITTHLNLQKAVQKTEVMKTL